MNYKILIYIDEDLHPVTLSVQYHSEYELKTDITNIGVKGFIQKLNEKTPNEYFLYYPPHKINRIEVLPLKD